MEPRHCERSEAIQGRHTHSLDRFVASLLAMTPYHQVLILSTSSSDETDARRKRACRGVRSRMHGMFVASLKISISQHKYAVDEHSADRMLAADDRSFQRKIETEALGCSRPPHHEIGTLAGFEAADLGIRPDGRRSPDRERAQDFAKCHRIAS